MDFNSQMETDLRSVFFNTNEFSIPSVYKPEGGPDYDINVIYTASGEILDPGTESLIISTEPRVSVIQSEMTTPEPGPEDRIELFQPGHAPKLFYVDSWEQHRQGTIILNLAEVEA
jgi:hypothetical protein